MRLPHTEVHLGRGSCRSGRLGLGLAITGVVLSLGGCGLAGAQGKLSDGYLPEGATEGADRVRSLWLGSWIAALAVGGLVWGLTIWCMVAYKRKATDPPLPVQLKYNVPMEILYTIVPIFMIGVLFYYTDRDERVLTDTATPSSGAGTSTTSPATRTRRGRRHNSPASPVSRRPSPRFTSRSTSASSSS